MDVKRVKVRSSDMRLWTDSDRRNFAEYIAKYTDGSSTFIDAGNKLLAADIITRDDIMDVYAFIGIINDRYLARSRIIHKMGNAKMHEIYQAIQEVLSIDEISEIIDTCIFTNPINGARYIARVPDIDCKIVSDLAARYKLYRIDIYNIWFAEHERLAEE